MSDLSNLEIRMELEDQEEYDYDSNSMKPVRYLKVSLYDSDGTFYSERKISSAKISVNDLKKGLSL